MPTAPEARCHGVEPHPRHYFNRGAGPTLCPGLVKGETPPPTPAGEADTPVSGVPVVDLGLLVRGLYEQAETCRQNAHDWTRLTRQELQRADYLEALAATLDGSVAAGVSLPGIREG